MLDLEASCLRDEESLDVYRWLCPSVCLRVERLHLTGLNKHALTNLLSAISRHLPRLRALSLASYDHVDWTINLPRDFCDRIQITDLTLVSMYIPWDSTIFSATITELNIHTPPDDPSRQPSFARFRDICAAMPSLRSLRLFNVVPFDSSGGKAINMPHTLRDFRFSTLR